MSRFPPKLEISDEVDLGHVIESASSAGPEPAPRSMIRSSSTMLYSGSSEVIAVRFTDAASVLAVMAQCMHPYLGWSVYPSDDGRP